jgi:hypothetical protein
MEKVRIATKQGVRCSNLSGRTSPFKDLEIPLKKINSRIIWAIILRGRMNRSR